MRWRDSTCPSDFYLLLLFGSFFLKLTHLCIALAELSLQAPALLDGDGVSFLHSVFLLVSHDLRLSGVLLQKFLASAFLCAKKGVTEPAGLMDGRNSVNEARVLVFADVLLARCLAQAAGRAIR